MPRYNWVAMYADDERFPQYLPDGTEQRYAGIDRSRVVAFSLFRDEELVVSVKIPEGARLVWRRRVERKVGSAGERALHLLGWQRTVAGRNEQCIACVFEDAPGVVVLDRWDERSRWFYKVVELPFE